MCSVSSSNCRWKTSMWIRLSTCSTIGRFGVVRTTSDGAPQESASVTSIIRAEALYAPHARRSADRAIQRCAVPMAGVGGCRVGRHQKIEQQIVRFGGSAHPVVEQNELT